MYSRAHSFLFVCLFVCLFVLLGSRAWDGEYLCKLCPARKMSILTFLG